jgi:insertion element IS1 protein InsB
MDKLNCVYCKGNCIRKGKTQKGVQKLYCNSCNKYQRLRYDYQGANQTKRNLITVLVKENCGIRSIARVLKLSSTTVIKEIKRKAASISKPIMKFGKTYEMDELKTFVSSKKNEQWLIYAIDKQNRKVVDFKIGKRNKRNLKVVTEGLVLSSPKRIFTDKLTLYKSLIPLALHKTVAHTTNYIERKNLTIRTHIKRLNRRTLCFSKTAIMLTAIMKLYFWG